MTHLHCFIDEQPKMVVIPTGPALRDIQLTDKLQTHSKHTTRPETRQVHTCQSTSRPPAGATGGFGICGEPVTHSPLSHSTHSPLTQLLSVHCSFGKGERPCPDAQQFGKRFASLFLTKTITQR